MSEIKVTRFQPAEGETVELPKKVGRVDTRNDSSPASGERFSIAVVGRGETEEHVLLSAPLESGEIQDNAQILATYLSGGKVWYAVPREAWE